MQSVDTILGCGHFNKKNFHNLRVLQNAGHSMKVEERRLVADRVTEVFKRVGGISCIVLYLRVYILASVHCKVDCHLNVSSFKYCLRVQ